jgi:hypothetical protein
MAKRTKSKTTAPRFPQPGNAVRLRTGKLLMTVFKVKGDTVTCHLEAGHAIQEKTSHRAELVAGESSGEFDQMSDDELRSYILAEEKELVPATLASLSDADLQFRIERTDQLRGQLAGEMEKRLHKKRRS